MNSKHISTAKNISFNLSFNKLQILQISCLFLDKVTQVFTFPSQLQGKLFIPLLFNYLYKFLFKYFKRISVTNTLSFSLVLPKLKLQILKISRLFNDTHSSYTQKHLRAQPLRSQISALQPIYLVVHTHTEQIHPLHA